MLKKLIGTMSVVAMAAMSTPASAFIVLDGWQLDTNSVGLPSLTTNIGHLELGGGNATVVQEVDGLGNPFVGAQFSEFGAVFSISYVQENSTGPTDFGLPSVLNAGLGLTVSITGLEGVVTSFNALTGALSYQFTGFGAGGGVTISGSQGGPSVLLAALGVAPPASGGNLNSFFGAAGTNGDSTLLLPILFTSGGDLFRDSSGTSLDSNIPGGLFMDVRTNNKISSPAGPSFDCDGAGPGTEMCRQISIQSSGQADLLRIPEPGMMLLLGAAFCGVGVSLRRKAF